MLRSGLLSLALLALVGDAPAVGPDPATLPGLRLYTVARRCGARALVSIHATAAEAIRAGEDLGCKVRVPFEVTAGTEGRSGPGEAPVLRTVYTRICPKSGWKKSLTFGDAAQAEAFAKGSRDKGAETFIVNDYAPAVVYQVYGDPCKAGRRALLGNFASAHDAFAAAKAFRDKGQDCAVFSGTRGREPGGAAVEYHVYVQGCKGSWSLDSRVKNLPGARDKAAAGRREDARVEVVHHVIGG